MLSEDNYLASLLGDKKFQIVVNVCPLFNLQVLRHFVENSQASKSLLRAHCGSQNIKKLKSTCSINMTMFYFLRTLLTGYHRTIFWLRVYFSREGSHIPILSVPFYASARSSNRLRYFLGSMTPGLSQTSKCLEFFWL